MWRLNLRAISELDSAQTNFSNCTGSLCGATRVSWINLGNPVTTWPGWPRLLQQVLRMSTHITTNKNELACRFSRRMWVCFVLSVLPWGSFETSGFLLSTQPCAAERPERQVELERVTLHQPIQWGTSKSVMSNLVVNRSEMPWGLLPCLGVRVAWIRR
jgi:hypothetical protein